MAYAKTDIGLIRKTNEDNYLLLPPHMFVVADGMGGHVAGEVASQQAVYSISQYMEAHADEGLPPELLLSRAVEQSNITIYRMARDNPEYSGMGTTVTAAFIQGSTVYWSHVGDSRLYMIHQEQLCQLTRDHSLVWELMMNGSLTKEEAESHPQRNLLTRAVGTGAGVQVDTGVTEWMPGDILLLCTDGLTGMVDESSLLKVLTSKQTIDEQMLELLFAQALDAGGSDNITAVLLQCQPEAVTL